MTFTPLATKLHIPRRRPSVPRTRLTERLDEGRAAGLTLISAPAGFGKTTLLTQWLAGDGRSTAWVSLDERDNDPTVFLTYVLSALQAAGASVAEGLRLLQSTPTTMREVLTILVNDLDTVAADVVLLLDDYHVIESHAVHEEISFLVDHLPSTVRLVIATRVDPPLPLARLRSRGELVEIRAEDLRFTPGEAEEYLRNIMGLTLRRADVAALEDRTEGWIAALQLAALSMQGRGDAADFIADFAGDNRYIVDYLVEEVLQRQGDDVRGFLLSTSILRRMNGALCDALMHPGGGGKAMLEALDRANLFLVPLDDRRHWYRYHHLFADVLRLRLLDERPDRVPELYRRATDWYVREGEPLEAIRYALAGGDAEQAADLVEAAIPALRRNRQEATMRHWLESLPERVLRERPALCTTFAGVLLMHGELDGVEQRLRDAERWLESSAGEATGADDELARAVRSEIALYRAGLAHTTGDITGTVSHALRVLELAAQDDQLLRGSASGLLGLAAWNTAELEDAHRWWSDSRSSLHRAGHLPDTLGVSIALADIELAQGRLRDAMETYAHGLQIASPSGSAPLRGASDMHVGMSEVLLERNEIAAARRHLAASAALGEHLGMPQNPHRRRVAEARLSQAEGDLAGAVDLLDDAERRYVSDMFPDTRPITALRARVWITQGRSAETLDWARGRGLSVRDDLTYLREFEHITLVRALLARHSVAGDNDALGDAVGLLQRLLRAAEHGGRMGSVLEILVLLAVAHRGRGAESAAVDALERALALAEPEGYVRVFVEEGTALAPLLRTVTRGGGHSSYTRSLLAGTANVDDGQSTQTGLVAPLSSRELDVLRLLGTDLDGPGIARHLVVSVNTVRTHTKNIYAKLGVTSRRAAIGRAAELGLLPRGSRR